jgi:hypothetical protein
MNYVRDPSREGGQAHQIDGMVPTSLLLARLSDSSRARPAKDAPVMVPARPRLGSHNVVTRPLAPLQPTPSQTQHEVPDHAVRRRTPPPPRFLAKPRRARRSSGWQLDVAAHAAGKRNAKKSSNSPMDSASCGMQETYFRMQVSVVGKNCLGGMSYLIVCVCL